MIYRLTTYRVPLTQLAAVRAEREDVAWPRLERAGAMPLALWRVLLGGRPGEVLELVRFDSLVQWAEATDGGLGDRGDLLPEQEIALQPASRRHPGGAPVRVGAGSVWALRRMVPQAGMTGRVVELTEEQLWPGFWSASQAEERLFTVGILHAHVAERHELYMLTHYAALADWETTRDTARLAQTGAAGQQSQAALQERRGLLADNGVRLLGPLSRRAPTRATCTEQGGGR
jgi:hypothetical protein